MRTPPENSPFLWHPYSPAAISDPPIAVHGARGCFLHTDQGKLLDGISSWWVNIHGHSRFFLARAVFFQTLKLDHVIFAGFTHQPALRLAGELAGQLPLQHPRIFFSDNGSTSVEIGLKMALQHFHNLDRPRRKILVFRGAYHGDTFGAMSAAERGVFTAPFHDQLFSVNFLPQPTAANAAEVLRSFDQLADEDTAAFLFEPLLQAAGGMNMYPADLLDQLLARCRRLGIVTIADEVMTGFHRTGTLFAMENCLERADIICLAKAISGGILPLAVTAASENIWRSFEADSAEKVFYHGHSYTANPIACSAALASLRRLSTRPVQRTIRELCEAQADFTADLTARTGALHPRHLGTVCAFDLPSAEPPSYLNPVGKRFHAEMLKRKILLRPLGNVAYIMPPYVLQKRDRNRMYRAVKDALSILSV